jgi:broad specificity polyphosphatase/5'/3'-nucleotidase SurE
MAAADPRFEVNDDGTAKDPVAFRQALREDKEKLKIIEVPPSTHPAGCLSSLTRHRPRRVEHVEAH